MPELELMPTKMDRFKAPHLLLPDEARLLQGIDVQFLQGRLVRGPGMIPIEITNASYTILSAFVAVRRDSRKMVIDCDTNGSVRGTTGSYSGLVSCGPVNEWVDPTDPETSNEDLGVLEESGGCCCCGGCCG